MKNGNKDFRARGGPGYESPLRVANYIPSPKENPGGVVFWDAGADFYGTLSIVEAKELIEVLQAIIADYPKEPTNEEILNELPNGSVIQFDDEKSRWVKTNSGILLSGDTSMEGDDLSIYEDMKITIKYRGDE